ncbi:metallophosphoesterase [Methanococcoides sp. FTZ1]|uniref:metallophosphoesterase n=1 Tax=Methanococcoides sp. FTZ1 TaxID=3439061 RepID=UPI003F8759C2
MKIIAVSDTHLKADIIPPTFKNIIDDCDMIVHAGDFTTMECYQAFNSTGKLKAVHGNSDDSELKRLLPEKLIFEVDGIRFGLVHEGALSIMDTTPLRYLALEMEVDVLIFGHIHRPLIEQSDVILICPGSPTSPRLSDPCLVEINVENGNISAKVIEVEGHSCGFIDFSRKLKDEN